MMLSRQRLLHQIARLKLKRLVCIDSKLTQFQSLTLTNKPDGNYEETEDTYDTDQSPNVDDLDNEETEDDIDENDFDQTYENDSETENAEDNYQNANEDDRYTYENNNDNIEGKQSTYITRVNYRKKNIWTKRVLQ